MSKLSDSISNFSSMSAFTSSLTFVFAVVASGFSAAGYAFGLDVDPAVINAATRSVSASSFIVFLASAFVRVGTELAEQAADTIKNKNFKPYLAIFSVLAATGALAFALNSNDAQGDDIKNRAPPQESAQPLKNQPR